MEEIYHIPALLSEAVAGLDIRPDGVYADATFGGGGHSRAILAALGPEGRLLGFDRDLDAMANAIDDPRFTFVRSDFRYMPNFMRYHGIARFDGILADLGVSFHHFDDASRGFSFRTDAPLDMRMNRRAPLTAATLVAEASEESLTAILRAYTDLKRPREVVRALLKARAQSPVTTTGALAEAVSPALNPKNEKKDLAQVFQALRIEVNGEMDALRRFLLATPDMLRPGGRLAILTYHSVEDRMVKNFMRCGNLEGREQKDFFGHRISPWKPVTRTPITPSHEEIEANPRSRSAKLRIAELLTPDTRE
ncbi:MAG: 16S rRNA (cytosine(1402)-N(4))-methyltransferase RsmH [Muribaculaceae bacterium]|nr:16S rRNA (cytosine(1402)-N(4))-methyltransferase RsmH [Muribaculaceae bacterium]